MAIMKPDKLTTKCRVVFNASTKNCNGISLNDNLLCGPKRQGSISHLLMKLRFNPVILLADVSRMYYKINYLSKVDYETTKPHDLRDLFRFLWRKNPDEPPRLLQIQSGVEWFF